MPPDGTPTIGANNIQSSDMRYEDKTISNNKYRGVKFSKYRPESALTYDGWTT